jgi:hypothetical protein
VGSVVPIGDEVSRLEIGADDLGWVARYLLNLPFEFEVEEPDELCAELASIGRRLTTAYA